METSHCSQPPITDDHQGNLDGNYCQVEYEENHFGLRLDENLLGKPVLEIGFGAGFDWLSQIEVSACVEEWDIRAN